MKITLFKSPKERITQDYDLTNCSVEELEKALTAHCELRGINSRKVAVIVPAGEYEESECIVKGTSTKMTIREVAIELLKMNGRCCYCGHEQGGVA